MLIFYLTISLLRHKLKPHFLKKCNQAHFFRIFHIVHIWNEWNAYSLVILPKFSYLDRDLPDIFLILITFKLSICAVINTRHNHISVSFLKKWNLFQAWSGSRIKINTHSRKTVMYILFFRTWNIYIYMCAYIHAYIYTYTHTYIWNKNCQWNIPGVLLAKN